jgi:hypothetical protein
LVEAAPTISVLNYENYPKTIDECKKPVFVIEEPLLLQRIE